MANEILCRWETHKPLLDARVKFDFVFAFAEVDDSGQRKEFAITHEGRQVFGEARKLKLKDRAMGRGDAEVTLDGDWWNDEATEDQKCALLDHEMHHIDLKTDKYGNAQFDDLKRPLLQLRKHDVEFGWFSIIAARHGAASFERMQAKRLAEQNGQFFWPEIYGKPGPVTVTVSGKDYAFENGALASLMTLKLVKEGARQEAMEAAKEQE